jgi:benzoate 4-monooxygenase
VNYLAFDVIGSFSFGRPFGFIKGGHDPYNLIHTIDTRGEVLNALGTVPPSLRRWMRYNIFDDFWAKGLRARAGLEKIGRDAFMYRKSSIADKAKAQRRDLLSFLFDARDPETGQPLADEEIVAESISFIVGGSDTTSSTMTNFIDLVSRRAEVKQKLHAELDEAFPDITLDWVAPDNIVQKLPYLNAVMREVMRYRPTSSTGLERITPSGGRVIGGKFIPAGVSTHPAPLDFVISITLRSNEHCLIDTCERPD